MMDKLNPVIITNYGLISYVQMEQTPDGDYYRVEDVDARIAELERQLAELREAAQKLLELVRMPTNTEEYRARAEVERVLEGMI